MMVLFNKLQMTNAMVILIKNNKKIMPQGVTENEDGTEKQEC